MTSQNTDIDDLSNLILTDDPEVQNAVFLTAFNSGVGAIFDSLYREDAISNLTGAPLTGSARTAGITELLATNPKLDSVVKYSHTTGDTSLIVVEFKLQLTDEHGQTTQHNGICTDVLVRESDGTWSMAIDRPIILESVAVS